MSCAAAPTGPRCARTARPGWTAQAEKTLRVDRRVPTSSGPSITGPGPWTSPPTSTSGVVASSSSGRGWRSPTPSTTGSSIPAASSPTTRGTNAATCDGTGTAAPLRARVSRRTVGWWNWPFPSRSYRMFFLSCSFL